MPPAPRQWSPEEDQIIMHMRAAGASWDVIERALISVGSVVKRSAIINRAKTLGVWDGKPTGVQDRRW